MNINKTLATRGFLVFVILGLLAKYGFLDSYFENAEKLSAIKPQTFMTPVNEISTPEQSNHVTDTKEILFAQLNREIEKLKSDLPIQNEDKSTFIDAVLNGNNVAYTIITPLHKTDFTEEYIKSINEVNCLDPDTIPYLDAGFIFTYKFFDLQMNRVFNLNINSNSCSTLDQTNTIYT